MIMNKNHFINLLNYDYQSNQDFSYLIQHEGYDVYLLNLCYKQFKWYNTNTDSIYLDVEKIELRKKLNETFTVSVIYDVNEEYIKVYVVSNKDTNYLKVFNIDVNSLSASEPSFLHQQIENKLKDIF